MKLARILLIYNIDNVRTSYLFTVKAPQTSSRILHESRKFCQRGSDFDNVFFLVDGGERRSKYHHKRTNIGPPAKEFHCRTVDGPTLNAGFVTL